ncbi:MAG: hypothetical protein LQ338_004296 [Usnochroma carphineum]|nr:MAG: hypothetical protein LQ338_004296 [Usnochroma carphineum]
MNAWHSLTLDERKFYERGKRQECYEAAIAEFNANIPLSPSVSGESSSDSDVEADYEDGGVRDRQAIQRWNRYRRDYRREPATNTPSGSSTSFPFLRLPFDIRRMVYTLVVNRSGPVIQMDADGSGKYPKGPIDLRLALASKQLFAEVMTTFFEDNVIELCIHPDPTYGLSVLFDPKAVSAAYWPFKSIKRIELFISYNQVEQGNFVRAELEKLCNVLQHCSLAKLCITAWCQTSWFTRGLEQSFDELLARLETLRDVQEFDFNEDVDTCWSRGLGGNSTRFLGTKEYRERLRGIVTKPREATAA